MGTTDLVQRISYLESKISSMDAFSSNAADKIELLGADLFISNARAKAQMDFDRNRVDVIQQAVNHIPPQWGPQWFEETWAIQTGHYAMTQKVAGTVEAVVNASASLLVQNKWAKIQNNGLVAFSASAYGTYRITARVLIHFNVSQHSTGVGWGNDKFSDAELYFKNANDVIVEPRDKHTLMWFKSPSIFDAGNQVFQLYVEHIFTLPKTSPAYNSDEIVTNVTDNSLTLYVKNNFDMSALNDQDDIEIQSSQITVERICDEQTAAEVFVP